MLQLITLVIIATHHIIVNLFFRLFSKVHNFFAFSLRLRTFFHVYFCKPCASSSSHKIVTFCNILKYLIHHLAVLSLKIQYMETYAWEIYHIRTYTEKWRRKYAISGHIQKNGAGNPAPSNLILNIGYQLCQSPKNPFCSSTLYKPYPGSVVALSSSAIGVLTQSMYSAERLLTGVPGRYNSKFVPPYKP